VGRSLFLPSHWPSMIARCSTARPGVLWACNVEREDPFT
jgi:hypothetical protein